MNPENFRAALDWRTLRMFIVMDANHRSFSKPANMQPLQEITADCAAKQAWFEEWPDRAEAFFARRQRPLVTVSYAQSVDGSIATHSRQQLQLSSHQSQVLTHRIRAACEAIIVGINTVLVDDPQLTVRLVDGHNPQPVVLDTNLRIPLEARLLDPGNGRCWVASDTEMPVARIAAVEAKAAEVLPCPRDQQNRVDLPYLLDLLGQRGIRSIMVEGGAQVISSFLEARLVDQLIITITPQLVGGLPALECPAVRNGTGLSLKEVVYETCGPDIILWARPDWTD